MIEYITGIIMNYIIPASVLLGALILVHEFGHFIVAKRLGIRVLKFSLGFGPKIIGTKIGETEYVLSLLPLGGYVKPLGETPDEPVSEADRPFSLTGQSPAKRGAVLIAGSLFNILFAFTIFACTYMIGVPALTPRIGAVVEGAPAHRAGLQEGDEIIAVNAQPIELWDELSSMVEHSNGIPLTLTVKRGDQQFTCTVQPQLTEGRTMFGETVQSYKIGIVHAGTPDARTVKRYNPVIAVWKAAQDTVRWSVLTLKGVWVLVKSPIERRNDIGGPILIGKLAGDFAHVGLMSFVLLMAMISVNLGVLNLLPIPILDGGHLLFLAIEGVKGRPLGIRTMEIAQQIGLAVLLMVMALVFYNDITRLIPK
ncbi:MAG: RIP metalloprotease RseP [Desulfobacterota bacterium]|nr:RIP metalloprotease RseP [Thermodesulfobacteriota bacterium]